MVQHWARATFFPFLYLGLRARGRLWAVANATFRHCLSWLGWELGRMFFLAFSVIGVRVREGGWGVGV